MEIDAAYPDVLAVTYTGTVMVGVTAVATMVLEAVPRAEMPYRLVTSESKVTVPEAPGVKAIWSVP